MSLLRWGETGIAKLRWGRMCRLVGMVVVLVFAFPQPTCANIPLPAAFGFVAPLWMAWLTFGLLFLTVGVIEAVILKLSLGIDWFEALAYSFGANAISTVFGGMFGLGSCILVPVAVVGALIGREISRLCNWKTPLAVITGTMIAFLLLVAIFASANLTWFNPTGTLGWTMYGSLIPAYFVSVLLENIVVRKWYGSHRTLRGVALANLVSYLFLVAVLVIAHVRPEENPLESVGWWRMQTARKVREGDIDGAIAMVREARKLQETQVGPWFQRRRPQETTYFATCEGMLARTLIELKRYSDARSLLRETLRMNNLSEYERQNLEELLRQIPSEAATSPTALSASPHR